MHITYIMAFCQVYFNENLLMEILCHKYDFLDDQEYELHRNGFQVPRTKQRCQFKKDKTTNLR